MTGRWHRADAVAGILLAVAVLSGSVLVTATGPDLAEQPISTAGAPPPAGGYFRTLPPGSSLPGDRECAQRVHRSTWEPRPENTKQNRATPGRVSLPPNPDYDAKFNATLRTRVTGNFVGTTDEIIQWASCKWGFEDDVTRAQAWQESDWYMAKSGDLTENPAHCPPDRRRALPCPESFGILQIKARHNPGSYPGSSTLTAFSLDYALAERRGCFEGMQFHGSADYGPGDLWGCIGTWYSGGWRDPEALDYIDSVQQKYDSKEWRTWP
jgi:autotransporter family porin